MPFPNSSFARVGKYTQIHLIGQGAGGNVYRAVDNIGRVVAVKEALPSRPGFIDTQERFEKEARIQAILKHRNIIQVYHLEEDSQTHELFLICEYANGGSLADFLRAHGPLSEHQAIRVALDISAALEEVSGRDFVHLDIKPSNILLFNDDQGQISEAKLGDFGVAKDLDKRRAGQPSTQRGGSHPGTPEYMAPEQADITKAVDVRTDLYALGISLWEMLTETDYKLVRASTGAAMLHTHNPQASLGIAEVIQRAVQADRIDRYPTPRALAADLQAVLGGRSLSAPPTIAFSPKTPPRRARLGFMRATSMLVMCLALALIGYRTWERSGLPSIAAPTSTPTVPTWLYAREGENPDLSTVGQMIQRSNSSGSKVHGQFGSAVAPPWPAKAGYVIYTNINIPQTDHLSLQLQYSKNSPSSVPILIFIDDEPTPRAVFNPIDQGNWNQFVLTQPIDLGKIGGGAHSIKFSTEGQQYGVADLDKFVLSDLTPPPTATVKVTLSVTPAPLSVLTIAQVAPLGAPRDQI